MVRVYFIILLILCLLLRNFMLFILIVFDMSNLNSEILIFTYSFAHLSFFLCILSCYMDCDFCFFSEICVYGFRNMHTLVF